MYIYIYIYIIIHMIYVYRKRETERCMRCRHGETHVSTYAHGQFLTCVCACVHICIDTQMYT